MTNWILQSSKDRANPQGRRSQELREGQDKEINQIQGSSRSFSQKKIGSETEMGSRTRVV